MSDKSPEFYKQFYEENRIRLLQYESLRNHFQKMKDDVLGDKWYSLSMDVYGADADICEVITKKANRTILDRLTE